MNVPEEALREILALPDSPGRSLLLKACSFYESLTPEQEEALYRAGVVLVDGRDPKALAMAIALGKAEPQKQNRRPE